MRAAKNVTLHWVPGHIDVEGNEKAHELARKGAFIPLVGPEQFRGLGDASIKEELKRMTETKRDGLWRDTEGLRQAKELLGVWNFKRFRE